ncbi:unnamed protein product [Cylicocyclus nassatus]|uniref:Uncharacterized protein n=1 Tax=Cylicocyclus nassatus TaxID=53992 RepID=A0AA36DK68_CYLNA|nr:unnamed protein product [Cylicocyclus nassatus]
MIDLTRIQGNLATAAVRCSPPWAIITVSPTVPKSCHSVYWKLLMQSYTVSDKGNAEGRVSPMGNKGNIMTFSDIFHMLVLPSDSGYNSPSNGIGPSSVYSLSEKFSKPEPDINSRILRKLRFEPHTCWNPGYFTPSKSSKRSREIAWRLIEMCDSFEKEFAKTNDLVENNKSHLIYTISESHMDSLNISTNRILINYATIFCL